MNMIGVWEIKAFNGTRYSSFCTEPLMTAVAKFKEKHGLHEMDIHSITRIS